MKYEYNKVMLLFLMIIFACPISAQVEIDTVQVMNRCKQEVGMLNAYIKEMAKREKSDISKLDIKESALSLFIYEGKDYTEIIERRNGERKTIHRQGVQMEISRLKWVRVKNRSFQREEKYKKPMGMYFNDVINYRYKSVEIQTTDIKDMQVGEIYQLDDGRYVCTIYFDQKFVGRMGDGKVYQDITHKYVVCYVDVIINHKSGRNEYIVRLGDVHVDSTEKVS